ncbi:MAG: phage holin family protein [Candidatus Obscuribacterales bacterium]|nr:phage holin family protein [Candidatus Obscuribacterales bacterium]
MFKFLLKTAATALAFMYVLPALPGIEFKGGFLDAAILAIVFAFLLWVVEVAAMMLATVWTITTLGLALLILIPLWIFGFWIFPALALELVAFVAPDHLSIHGFLPPILGGLTMMIISMLTGGFAATLKCLDKARGRD